MNRPDWLTTVPQWAWPIVVATVALVALVALPVARRRAYRAGRAAAGLVDDRSRRDRIKDRALLVAAMVPAVGFWGAVLAGSLKGLTAFGRDTLRWTGGSEYLVPATLDGVAVGFGVLAFRAVRKGRAPDRANRVVWGAAIASATINFAHEAGLQNGSVIGGAYLALLSLFGMVMFHEFLDQFETGAAEGHVRRAAPRFGLRWLTAPWSTLCAALAWRNQPPVDGTPVTVRAALDHLDAVRATKRARREADRLADHQWALDAETRRIELATAKALQPTAHTDQPNGSGPTGEATAGGNREPTSRSPRKATKRRTKPRVYMAWSPAVVANARALRERFGDRIPADMSDRQVRNAMGWSHVRAQPALAAYRAGADREPRTEQEDAA